MKRRAEDLAAVPQLDLFDPAALAAARLQAAIDLQAAPAQEPELPRTNPPNPAPPPAPAAPSARPAWELTEPPFAVAASGFPAKAVLVDGQALLERCAHSPKLRESRTAAGAPNGLIRGVVRVLLQLLGAHQPAVCAVVWEHPDNAGTRRRREFVPAYRKDRPAPDPADDIQQTILHEICAALGVCSIETEASEGRDVLGTLVSRMPADWEVLIYSARTSLLSLDRAGCSLAWWRSGQEETTDLRTECRRRLQLLPSQVPLYLALSGQSEGLPGFDGIGPKTAHALVRTFGTLDGIERTVSLGLPDVLLRVVGEARLRNGQKIGRRLVEIASELRAHVFAAALHRDIVAPLDGVPCADDMPGPLSRQAGNPSRLRALGETWSINELTREVPIEEAELLLPAEDDDEVPPLLEDAV